MTPQELVERCLELSRSDGLVVIVDDESTATIRWAANALTGAGTTAARRLTVIAVSGTTPPTAYGIGSGTADTVDAAESLVRAAERAAAVAPPTPDARPLVSGQVSGRWTKPPGRLPTDLLPSLAAHAGRLFERADDARQLIFGHVSAGMRTTYLGSSTGLRLRHEQPGGQVSVTAADDGSPHGSWVGRPWRHVADLDHATVEAMTAARRARAVPAVTLPGGEYDVVIPPAAVADLVGHAYLAMRGRDRLAGRSVGERLSTAAVSLWSDPAHPGLACAPFVVARGPTTASTVFDNGLPVWRTDWISDGELAALPQTRHSAQLTGLPATPPVDNLVMAVDTATGTVDDLVAGVERGLLVTSWWHTRVTDSRSLRLTGTTRDGVYLIEDGRIAGTVDDVRIDIEPLAVLGRFSHAGASVPTLSRQLGHVLPRLSMPPLRIPDFPVSPMGSSVLMA